MSRYNPSRRSRPLYLLVLTLLAAPVLAAAPGASTPAGHVYTSPDGLVATFPADTFAAAEVLRFDQRAMMAEVGTRVKAWARDAAPGLTVTVRGREITFEAEGTSAAAVEQSLADAAAERERIYARVLSERRLMRAGFGQVQYDHARIAAESAPLVRPLALALATAAGTDPRAFAERALLFVQNLPYEKVSRATFAPPLALLREERGDCDEKATLYAALLRAYAPDLRVAIITMDQHAIVGLGLPARGDDRAVSVDEVTWLVAEVAGPALDPLGTLSPKTTLDRGFTLRRVP